MFDKIYDKLAYTIALFGIVCSAASVINFCTEACSAAHEYSFFGLNMGWIGIFAFSSLIAIRYASHTYSKLRHIYMAGIAGALGAEIWFLYVQKAVIKQWCPLCITIAGTVFLLAMVHLVESRKSRLLSTDQMHSAGIAALIMLFGFGTAFLGVRSESGLVDNAQASAILREDTDYSLGQGDNDRIVYIISDWYCPACRAFEVKIEKLFPVIAESSKIQFVDLPIHKESLNFTPYNAYFMAKEKNKYIQIRSALSTLAAKTKEPTTGDVNAAVKHIGVKVRPIDTSESLQAMMYFYSVAKKYDIKVTPTILITDREGREIKRLEGGEISEQAIMASISGYHPSTSSPSKAQPPL